MQRRIDIQHRNLHLIRLLVLLLHGRTRSPHRDERQLHLLRRREVQQRVQFVGGLVVHRRGGVVGGRGDAAHARRAAAEESRHRDPGVDEGEGSGVQAGGEEGAV